MAAGGAAGAAAGAAAEAMRRAQAYQLLVGGLLLQLPPDGFLDVYRKLGGIVFTGCTKTFWTKRPRTRFYFLPYQGVTVYCKVDPEATFDVPGAVDVPHLKFGPLAEFLGK